MSAFTLFGSSKPIAFIAAFLSGLSMDAFSPAFKHHQAQRVELVDSVDHAPVIVISSATFVEENSDSAIDSDSDSALSSVLSSPVLPTTPATSVFLAPSPPVSPRPLSTHSASSSTWSSASPIGSRLSLKRLRTVSRWSSKSPPSSPRPPRLSEQLDMDFCCRGLEEVSYHGTALADSDSSFKKEDAAANQRLPITRRSSAPSQRREAIYGAPKPWRPSRANVPALDDLFALFDDITVSSAPKVVSPAVLSPTLASSRVRTMMCRVDGCEPENCTHFASAGLIPVRPCLEKPRRKRLSKEIGSWVRGTLGRQ